MAVRFIGPKHKSRDEKTNENEIRIRACLRNVKKKKEKRIKNLTEAIKSL